MWAIPGASAPSCSHLHGVIIGASTENTSSVVRLSSSWAEARRVQVC